MRISSRDWFSPVFLIFHRVVSSSNSTVSMENNNVLFFIKKGLSVHLILNENLASKVSFLLFLLLIVVDMVVQEMGVQRVTAIEAQQN